MTWQSRACVGIPQVDDYLAPAYHAITSKEIPALPPPVRLLHVLLVRWGLVMDTDGQKCYCINLQHTFKFWFACAVPVAQSRQVEAVQSPTISQMSVKKLFWQ